MRVRFGGVHGIVDFTERRWSDTIATGQQVDIEIRRSFHGQEYDGQAVQRAIADTKRD